MPMAEQGAATSARHHYVVICERQGQVGATLAALHELTHEQEFSLLTVSSLHCLDQMERFSTAALLRILLREIAASIGEHPPVPWYRQPRRWLQKQAHRTELSQLITALTTVSSDQELRLFVDRYAGEIREQFEHLVQVEGRQYTLVALTNYEVLPKDQQPETAAFIQRLLSGTSAYFRILSVGQLTLLRMEAAGSVGIELDQDYRLIQLQNEPSSETRET